jgi:uncharacterized membrane protein YuzA (DUF378 family)
MINIFNQFEDVKPYMNEAVLLVESGIFDNAFDDELNEESIMAKMKAKFDNAVQIAKEKGKKALTDTQEKILQLGGKIGSVIKTLVSALAKWISDTFSAAKAHFSKVASASNDKITAAVTKIEDTNKLAIEVKNLKAVIGSTGAWLKSGLVNQVSGAAASAAKEDANENIDIPVFEIILLESINDAVISGDLNFMDLLEGEGGIPFVSAIAHKLHEFPPFNLLHKVQGAAEKVASGVLNKLSYYATELAGAPGPYEFVALAAIIGIVAEVQFKGMAKTAIINLIPGIGTIASVISYVAMGLAVVGIVEALIKKQGEDQKSDH